MATQKEGIGEVAKIREGEVKASEKKRWSGAPRLRQRMGSAFGRRRDTKYGEEDGDRISGNTDRQLHFV